MITLKSNQLIQKIDPSKEIKICEGFHFGEYAFIVKVTAAKITVATIDPKTNEIETFVYGNDPSKQRFFNDHFKDVKWEDLPSWEKGLQRFEFKNKKKTRGMEGNGFSVDVLIDGKKVCSLIDYADGAPIFLEFKGEFNESTPFVKSALEELSQVYGSPFMTKNCAFDHLLTSLFFYMDDFLLLNQKFSQFVEEERKSWQDMESRFKKN